MAHLKAEVDANITPFQKKLKEASEKAREFAKEAGKTLNDVGKETGMGGLTKMLGLAGGTVAVTAFGVALVEAIKGGLEEAGKFETQVFEMGTALKDMDLGKEMTEWAEKTDSSVGTATERIQAMKSLLQSGLDADQAKAQFQSFADMVAGAGGNIAEMAEGFRHMSVGQGEEKTSGMQRLMKGSGAMEEVVRDDKAAYERQLKEHLSGIPRIMATSGQVEEEEANLKRVHGMSLTDYVKEFIKPEDMKGMMSNTRYTGSAAKKGDTYEGKLAQLQQQLAEAQRKFGEELLPSAKKVLDEIIKAMPDVTDDAKKLGEAFAKATPAIEWFIRDVLGIGEKKAKPNSMMAPGIAQFLENAAQGFADIQGKIDLAKPENQSPEAQARIHKAIEEQTAWLKQFFNIT